MIDEALIEDARSFLYDRVRLTPVERAPRLDEAAGGPVWLKLENLQLTGSFKVRGASFFLSRLDPAARSAGVAACSAGNHGLGVAWAARELGIDATIYVPSNVDPAKYRGMVDLGAKVIRSDFAGYDETADWAHVRSAEAGTTWVPAFDDDAIMAANGGTLAAEVLEQRPDARRFILPVGGGGLAGGFASYVHRAVPDARIVGVQHADCPALALSVRKGAAMTRMPAIDTVAAGIEGGLGVRNFEVLRECLSGVVHVTEDAIRAATAWMVDAHQMIAEPTAAAAVAAVLFRAVDPDPRETVVVITGRNVAISMLADLLAEAERMERR